MCQRTDRNEGLKEPSQLIGWALCGAIMGIGRVVTALDNTLVIHAIGAPIIFVLISWVYFVRFGYLYLSKGQECKMLGLC